MLDFIGYALAFIAIVAKIVSRIGGSATFILIILAFCGIVNWSLVLTVFLVALAATVLSVITIVSAKAILG